MVVLLRKEFGHIVLKTVVRGITKNVIVRFAVNLIGKTVLLLAKMTAYATSIIGVVLTIGAEFDLLFTIWEPYNYNKMLNTIIKTSIMIICIK